jgi:hypothetical protein
LVTQAGGNLAAAPRETYRTTAATQMFERARGRGDVLRNLTEGSIVYPTGEREGMWWQVYDDNDNLGWVNNDVLAQAQ